MLRKTNRWIIFCLYVIPAFAGYAVFFLIFHPVIGESVAIFTFVPPIVIAWRYGIKIGIIAGIAADILTLFLLQFEGVRSWDAASLKLRLPGLIAVVIISAVVGYMHNLREKIKEELEEKKKTETALRESEARFKAIYEGSNDALMLLDEKGFFDCNPRTLEMFGITSKEEFTKVQPADISPPKQPDGKESFPAAQERIKTAFEQGSNRFEWVHRRKSGEDFPVEVLLSAFSLNGRRVLQATVRDISKRKLAEAALVESEKSFRSMFEMTSECVALISSKTNKFIAANPAMCATFGYSEEEFRSLTPEDITPAESKEIMRRSMKTLADGVAIPDHEGTSIRKDGTTVNVIVSNRHMFWKREPIFHVTFKDVTFLKEIQENLKKKNAEILEFTNTVTHDLKKPLTVMKTICSLIKSSGTASSNPDTIEATEIGAEAIQYMQDMLDDLLVSAKLESGTADLALEEFSFKEAVGQVIQRLKISIEEKRIKIDIGENDMLITADFKQIGRLLMNLIGNAINYIGDKPDKHISIRWEQKDGPAVFTIEDNGIGIPLESQSHLFTKFKRGANVSGISGTGLGLSIVKGIVLAHGGKIWFESKEGEGTAFHFTLG